MRKGEKGAGFVTDCWTEKGDWGRERSVDPRDECRDSERYVRQSVEGSDIGVGSWESGIGACWVWMLLQRYRSYHKDYLLFCILHGNRL